MTTAPPKDRFDTLLKANGFGEVDYFGVGEMPSAPAAPKSWASKVQKNSAPSITAPDDAYVATTIDAMEQSLQYPDLTAEEQQAINNPADRKKYALTIAEWNQLHDTEVKWVKSGGTRDVQHYATGVTAGIYTRGNLHVYEITQPDGYTCYFTREFESETSPYSINENGELITIEKNGFATSTRPTRNVMFIDCCISNAPINNVIALSEKVNGRKGDVLATLEPDGHIRIAEIRGIVKPNQYVVKSPSGIFITVDSKGQPMLADLNAISKDIPLTQEDFIRQKDFASSVARGENTLETIARFATAQEKQGMLGTFELSDEDIRHTYQAFQKMITLDKNAKLETTSQKELPFLYEFSSHVAALVSSREKSAPSFSR
jgi:hypothetical protein